MASSPSTVPAWQPTASLENLRRRAALAAEIRRFFAERGVLEVETPQLGAATVPDLHLASLEVRLDAPGLAPTAKFYLQTSPELAMKRLLAAGSGPIFQLCKAYRNGEAGARHNPEFTLLEWYRPGFDHHQLMDEMSELLGRTLGAPPAERQSYRELFLGRLGLDPLEAGREELSAALTAAEVPEPAGLDRDGALQLLLACALEPGLGWQRPYFLYDFPPSQAALARIDPGPPPVAQRFEVYVRGLELANGFHELADPLEQRRRFEADLEARARSGLPRVALDQAFLAALEAGLPACSGVALGFDRLVMLATGARSIDEVLSFPIERA